MQPGKHPDAVTWNEPSGHTIENLWIDYDGSYIIDNDGARIIIGDYIEPNVNGGIHIPLIIWTPLG